MLIYSVTNGEGMYNTISITVCTAANKNKGQCIFLERAISKYTHHAANKHYSHFISIFQLGQNMPNMP